MSPKAALSSAARPLSDCEVIDPRVRRTRQLLQGALRTLLQKKSFDDISVQDIADRATVNRVTFYDHYPDKYSLLEASVASGFHALLAERRVSFDGSCASAAGALILATCDFLAQSRINEIQCERPGAFEPLTDAAVIAAIRRVLKPGIASDLKATTASWAIYGAAKEWFATSQRPPAEKMVPEVLKLVLPLLEK
jgi:AcrR family transcriptional regulator